LPHLAIRHGQAIRVRGFGKGQLFGEGLRPPDVGEPAWKALEVELYGIESFPPTLGLRAWQAYDEITSVGGLAASA
jgi:hypothetical protein